MGQQQLLLVILVTILVGLATIVALNAFGNAAEAANRDAVRQDLLHGATMAQALHTRPRSLGGIGQDFTDFDDLLQRLGMPVTYDEGDGALVNENGKYSLDGEPQTDSFRLMGEPDSGGEPIIAIVCKTNDGQWEIAIGEDPDDPCQT